MPTATDSNTLEPKSGLMDNILETVSQQAPKEKIDIDIAPKELPDGYRLRNYKIHRTLGAGGFGITYLAVEDLLNRPVVIKENFPDSLCYRESNNLRVRLSDPENNNIYEWALTNFLREVRLLATLDHLNIAKVYSYFEAHGTAYYVTEYIDGKNLGEVAKDYADHNMNIPQDALYGTLIRILDALDYLHQRNLLHRDIKPDNILVTRQGRPMLIDFGAARDEYGDLDANVIESQGFSPSEQGEPGGNMGPWTDIYALGATLYFVLTGQCLPASKQRLLFDTVDPLSAMPHLQEIYHPNFLKSIDRALSPTIEKRYHSISEWINDLNANL